MVIKTLDFDSCFVATTTAYPPTRCPPTRFKLQRYGSFRTGDSEVCYPLQLTPRDIDDVFDWKEARQAGL